MDQHARAVFLFTRGVVALADIEAMKAANVERERKGEAPAYGEEAFMRVSDFHGLGHNTALAWLKGDGG